MKLGGLVHKMGFDKTEVPMTVGLLHEIKNVFEAFEGNCIKSFISVRNSLCQCYDKQDCV